MINNNLHPSNYINSKSQLNIHKIQLERLLKVTSKINNSSISPPKFIIKKFSKKLKEKEENDKINYENSILFNRMLALVKKPSPYNINISRPIYCPAFDNKNSSYKKSQSIEKIKKNNKFLYNRFLNAKSYYETSKILKQNDFYKYLEGNFKNLYRKIHNLNFCTFEKFKENIKNEMKKSDFFYNNNNNILKIKNILFSLHSYEITSLNYNSDLNLLASSSIDGQINIFSFPQGNIIFSLKFSFPIDNILLFNFPIPSFIIYSKQKEKIFSYSLNGVLLRKLEEKTFINPICYYCNNENSNIIYINNENSIKIINLPFFNNDKTKEITFDYNIISFDISNDNNMIYILTKDGEKIIKIYK